MSRPLGFLLRLVIITIVCGSSAHAQTTSWNPLWAAYVTPLPPRTPLNHACQLGLNASIVSYLASSEGAWGLIATNFEEWRFDFSLRSAIARTAGLDFEWGVNLPLRAFLGGIFDGPLDVFHQALGVGFNPPGEQNQVLLLVELPGYHSVLTVPAFGFGDPHMWLTGTFRPAQFGLGTPGSLRASLGLKAPLGDATRWLGGGIWSTAGSLAWNDDVGAVGIQVLMSTPIQTQAVLGQIWLRPSFGLSAWWSASSLPSLGWTDAPEWLQAFKLELALTSGPLPTGGRFAEPSLALRVDWHGLGFVEDFQVSQADLVLDGHMDFACP